MEIYLMRHHQKTLTKAPETILYKNAENSVKSMQSDRTYVNPILSLQKTIGNHAVNHLIQAKLKINQPGDIYEQEADRVADMVMRMSEPILSDKQGVASSYVGANVQRKYTASSQVEKQLLQAKEELGHTPEVTPQIDSSIKAIKGGGGHPLPVSVRQFFEPRLGQDFSHVRIHMDGRAAQTAQAVNALAFTTGRDIVFGTGQYSPGTAEGNRLLAHELTHVMQQSKGGILRVQRAEMVQRATRSELLSALREAISNENWQEVATRLNGFNEDDIKRLAGGLTVGEAANTRAAVQQYLGGWPREQLILDSLDAGRKEVARIGAVYLAYSKAIQTADWISVAQQLSAMSENDINSRLEKLKDDDIMAVRNAAATETQRVRLACDVQIARRGLPVEKPSTTDFANPGIQSAAELIDRNSDWLGGLKNEQLGAELLEKALDKQYALVHQVLDKLGWTGTDKDDICLAMMQAPKVINSDLPLREIAESEEGRRLLDRMFDELTSGYPSDDEKTAANRILKIKTLQVDPTQFERKDLKIFPSRSSGLTVLDDTLINAERRSGGMIWVRIDRKVAFFEKYKNDAKTLPSEVYTKAGILLPENEIVVIRNYDEGEKSKPIYAPALILVEMSNKADTSAAQTTAAAAAMAATMGAGPVVEGGGALGNVLIWTDRAATILGTLTTLADEHRGWIIDTFDRGQDFVNVIDRINSVLLYYGAIRGGIAITKGAAGTLKRLSVSLEATYSGLKNTASKAKVVIEDMKLLQKIEDQVDALFKSIDEIMPAYAHTPEGVPMPIPKSNPAVEGALETKGSSVTQGPAGTKKDIRIMKKGPARIGGAYKDIAPNGEEVHHMPADSISPYSTGKGPGIRMEIDDHKKTASWGTSKEAEAYRAKQKKLIDEGKFREAQQMDIDDVRLKFGNKYDLAIEQMLTYTNELLK